MKRPASFLTAAGVFARLSNSAKLPPQTVVIDVPELAVLGNNGQFRNVTTLFNPTNTTPPFFQGWDSRFLDILGPNPSFRLIAERDDGFLFAHEAPIWDPATDNVFFSSFSSMIDVNTQISTIDLKDIKPGPGSQNISITKVPITPEVEMVNGGTPFGDKLLFVTNGRGNNPPGVVLVNPRPPFNSTIILDNFHGRQFNSIDDVKVNPKSGAIFFTDVTYGFVLGFRPPPLLLNQVYRLDPETREVRVVADGFSESNGIAFSPDGSIAYIGDSGALGSTAGPGFDGKQPSTIYAFDVDPKTQQFMNRRVFAWIDTGIPDGIQVDSKGNVYASTGDGVHIFDTSGTLLGKLFIGGTTANHIFAGKGRLVILGESKIFFVEFAAAPSLVELKK